MILKLNVLHTKWKWKYKNILKDTYLPLLLALNQLKLSETIHPVERFVDTEPKNITTSWKYNKP